MGKMTETWLQNLEWRLERGGVVDSAPTEIRNLITALRQARAERDAARQEVAQLPVAFGHRRAGDPVVLKSR